MTTDETSTSESVTFTIEKLHEINERFNAFLARKARAEGRIHMTYQKLIDSDLIEWAARAKAGLLSDCEKPFKLPVKEEDCPISERTGKRKLAIWDPIKRAVTGYKSETDEDELQPQITTTAVAGEDVPELACPSSGSADSPRPTSDSETAAPPNTPLE